MQRVWVVVLSVWAMLAIVAVLAWSSRPTVAAAPPAAAAGAVVKGPNGKSHLVVLKSPAHATTATSAVVARMNTLHRTEWRAVGTTCAAAVTAGAHDEHAISCALAAARDEVAACERELSRFDPASDLSRLNAAGGRWIPIGRRLLEALGSRSARGRTPAAASTRRCSRRWRPPATTAPSSCSRNARPGPRTTGVPAAAVELDHRERPRAARAGLGRRPRRDRQGLRRRPRARRDARRLAGSGRRARRPRRRHRRVAASPPKAVPGSSRSPTRAARARRSQSSPWRAAGSRPRAATRGASGRLARSTT